MIIILMPVFGVLLFWYTRSELGHRALKARLDQTLQDTKYQIHQNEEVLHDLERKYPEAASLAHYLQTAENFPVYRNTEVSYFESGEKKFEALLNELKKADKFIFMEYFIVDEGKMWGRIFEVLVAKAKQGVEVKVMIDGTCEFTTLPYDYPELLKNWGLNAKCLPL